MNENYDLMGYNIEHTLAIGHDVVTRAIKKHRRGLDCARQVSFSYDTKEYVGCLPYGIVIKLEELPQNR